VAALPEGDEKTAAEEAVARQAAVVGTKTAWAQAKSDVAAMAAQKELGLKAPR
jgi:hypothetical protein